MEEKKKKSSFLDDLFTELLEEPVVLVPMMLIAILSMPVWLTVEHKRKKKLIATYGQIQCNIESFDKLPGTTEEYMCAVMERLREKVHTVENKHYRYSYGFMNTEQYMKELDKLEPDKQTAEFISYHLDKVFGLGSEQNITELLELLSTKQFYEANKYLEKHSWR